MLLVLAGVQYLLPATWTALHGQGVDLLTLSHLLSTNPAHLIGNKHKGILHAHKDADIVVSPVMAVLVQTQHAGMVALP